MMRFTVEEKVQIIKWYFSGHPVLGVVNLFTAKYGYERAPSESGIRYAVQVFEKHGCFQNYCRNCLGYKSREMTDEEELNEIMVCAASELELSIRDIAIELEMAKSTVSKILKRNGYSTTSVIEGSTTDTPCNKSTGLEKLSDERKQIIKWYCQKNTLSKMIQYFSENFNNHKDRTKKEIIHTVKLFELYGCIRNCNKCQKNKIEGEQNFKTDDIEYLISKQATELQTNSKSEVAQSSNAGISSTTPRNKKIKLECLIEPTSLSHPLETVENELKHKNLISEEKNIDDTSNSDIKREPLSDELHTEFVSVNPTIDLIVIEEKTSKKNEEKTNSIIYSIS